MRELYLCTTSTAVPRVHVHNFEIKNQYNILYFLPYGRVCSTV
jgi:hypothetical protein